MKNIYKSNVFLPQSNPILRDKIQRLINLSMKGQDLAVPEPPTYFSYWKEDFFKLEKTTFWKNLNDKEKNEVLTDLSQSIITEALLIEIAGMFYGSKMNQASESLEERVLYSFITKEEAKHFQLLLPFSKTLYPENIPSFPSLISEIIETENKISSLVLIQVLLEGWGLYYYSTLKDQCQNKDLTQVLKSIVLDEARHHSSGVILSKEKKVKLTPSITKLILKLCQMIQIGPYNLTTTCFSKLPKSLNQEKIYDFLYEVDAYKETQKKLNVIKLQLKKVFSENEINLLTNKNAFAPLPIKEMSALMTQDLSSFSTFEALSL